MINKLITLKDVAVILGTSVGYTRKFIKKNLPICRVDGRIRVWENDLYKLLESRTIKPGAGRDIGAQKKGTHSDGQENVDPSTKVQSKLNIVSPTPGNIAIVNPVTPEQDKPDHYDIIDFDDDDDDDDDQCSPSNS